MKMLVTSLTLCICLLCQPAAFAEASGISKQRAVEIADRAFSGRVLAVKRRGDVYRVKKLNDKGEVRIIVIDADSGKVVSK